MVVDEFLNKRHQVFGSNIGVVTVICDDIISCRWNTIRTVCTCTDRSGGSTVGAVMYSFRRIQGAGSTVHMDVGCTPYRDTVLWSAVK